MSPLPLSTTTVLVELDERTEPDDAPSYGTPSGPHPAHVSAPTGTERVGGQGVERIDAALYVDEDVTLAAGARITDQGTGLVYRLAWSTPRQGLGLAHQRAGLVLARGAVPA